MGDLINAVVNAVVNAVAVLIRGHVVGFFVLGIKKGSQQIFADCPSCVFFTLQKAFVADYCVEITSL